MASDLITNQGMMTVLAFREHYTHYNRIPYCTAPSAIPSLPNQLVKVGENIKVYWNSEKFNLDSHCLFNREIKWT